MNFILHIRVSIGTPLNIHAVFPSGAVLHFLIGHAQWGRLTPLFCSQQADPPPSKLIHLVMAARRIGGLVLLVAVSTLLVWRVQGQTSKLV